MPSYSSFHAPYLFPTSLWIFLYFWGFDFTTIFLEMCLVESLSVSFPWSDLTALKMDCENPLEAALNFGCADNLHLC